MTNVQFELLAKLIRININKSISKELASIEVRVENDSLVVYLYPVENSSLINTLNLVENEWVGYGFLLEKDESFLPEQDVQLNQFLLIHIKAKVALMHVLISLKC
jgi:hypothetical protein